jgi:hypothetical protein
MIRTFFATTAIALVTALPVQAQPVGATPADVASPEAVVHALYQTVNRRPGQPFDWPRMRALFTPTARMIPNTEQTGGTLLVMTPEQFIARIDSFTVVGGANDKGFQEEEIATIIERFGDIAHAFSTYQKHFYGSSQILGRGINSIQMLRHDGRWWITHIIWDEESGAGPLPAKYLPGSAPAGTGERR